VTRGALKCDRSESARAGRRTERISSHTAEALARASFLRGAAVCSVLKNLTRDPGTDPKARKKAVQELEKAFEYFGLNATEPALSEADHPGGSQVDNELTGACTGRSAGFSPLRMRST
jgi:hypothetical protein